MPVAAGDIVLASDMNTAQSYRIPVVHLGLSVDSAALGTAETVFMTIPSTLYKANTAYRFRFEFGYTTSVASAGFYLRLRKTNLAGAVVVDMQRQPEVAANNTLAHRTVYDGMFTTLSSAVTAAMVVTAATTTGTVVVKGAPPSVVDITEVGAQADWPDAQDLT